MLPGVSSMQRLTYRDGRMLPTIGGEEEEDVAFGGYDCRRTTLSVTPIPSAGPGFQDTIRLLYGYLPLERKVVGMEILAESRDTRTGRQDLQGCGLRRQLRLRSPSTPRSSPSRKVPGSAPNEVDAITGATISSKAVVQIINRGNQRWIPRFSGSEMFSEAAPCGR